MFALNFFDILYILILAIGLIIGLKKGCFKTLIGLLKCVISIVVAMFFCKPIASLMFNSTIGQSLTNAISNLFSGNLALSNVIS